MMKFKELITHWAVRNLLLAAVIVVVFVVSVNLLLSVATQHNKTLPVPDFTNLTYDEAYHLASASGVRVTVADSMYIRRLKPGAVYLQTPKPGEMVKRGRRIRLTTNTVKPAQVTMPSLVGSSLKQAKAELLRNGLSLGRLVYIPDIASNCVLRQQMGGRDVPAGKKVTSGSSVNLVLGINAENAETFVPNLVGRQYLHAVDALQENYLNVGRLNFDSSVHSYADSVAAVVYAQRPSAGGEAVTMGTEVTLSLTTDLSKVPSGKR